MTLVKYVKNCISVRRFTEEDAEEVSKLVVRNFLEVNSKDYGIAAMEKLAKVYDSGKVLNIANYAHMYVFEWNGKIVGTGSISSFWRSKTESILLTIFVLPELHGKGIGRKIINTLEQDEFYVRARLNEYLHKMDEECHEMLDRIVEKMKEKQGVTEQLKAENQMLWVGKMNNIIACAEEVVVRELVYV